MTDDPRGALRAATLADETRCVERLVTACQLDAATRAQISQDAAALIEQVRTSGQVGIMEKFLAEYGLTTKEGVALMCLAEAMLRVPDATSVDALIKDKITPHDWSAHLGAAGSILVNASTWGLMLTGRVIDDDEGAGIAGTLHSVVRRLGEPVVRKAVGQAMTEMGNQFVLGRTIKEAMKRGQSHVKNGYSYSYDMLGEAARTQADAQRYFDAYARAIAAISDAAKAADIRDNPGISVKLSALHPRYEAGQRERMLPALSARLLELAQAAKAAGIGLNIDAEEADRLDLSLDVIEAVLPDPSLSGWDGFGVVVQAYSRRAPQVIDWLYALSERLDRKIMVRLVKGAYWDMEIKRAQVMGLKSFPVFTRKSHTDISYLACARQLLGLRDRIYPQFATHNAHSAAAVLRMAGGDVSGFEFQRLHGMGEALHAVLREASSVRCRIYAPVGAHADLLAYLVRRLLENGANGSFVNQIVDLSVPAEIIAQDPIALAQETGLMPSVAIQHPDDLFAPRRNSRGWDITDPVDIAQIETERAAFNAPKTWSAKPLTPINFTGKAARELRNPALNDDIVGSVVEADADLVEDAIGLAGQAQPEWAARMPDDRAAVLRRIADLYEANTFEFLALATREAGKTPLDGVAELREAVDFLRYYADAATRTDDLPARGVIACISPLNFPLAIFTGQIAAALVAGNAVIAKPAEQTPLIAYRAVQMMLQSGVPRAVLQLLPGDGVEVGAPLCADPRIAGVCFTGSTEVAKIIDRQLAQTAPDALLLAETGGLNAMIVDSTALIEQAVRDIIRAAFQSAGQRCSALRVLYVQEDIEAELLAMLRGAMDALVIGDPWEFSSDVGPVIDAEAHQHITTYISEQKHAGHLLHQLNVPTEGLFVPPTVLKTSGIHAMDREIFGPVLHVATFKADELDEVVDEINAKGFGLTFGLHTRVDRRVQRVLDRIHMGNVYVNRDQIGAVVGSQPFGGHGLSGTGPKAGGTHYLPRFQKLPTRGAQEAPDADILAPQILSEALAQLDGQDWAVSASRVATLRSLLRGRAADVVSAAASVDFGQVDLPGPTGEANQYALGPRGQVLCLGPDDEALMTQVVQALAAGNAVLAIAGNATKALAPLLQEEITLPLAVLDGRIAPEDVTHLCVDVVAHAGAPEVTAQLRRALAARPGPIVPIVTAHIDPVAYAHERTICIDTTAAGGNVSLLSMS